MGRAFQYSGANAVLMTLWNVEETASVRMVEDFFKGLHAGKGNLESLSLARLEARQRG